MKKALIILAAVLFSIASTAQCTLAHRFNPSANNEGTMHTVVFNGMLCTAAMDSIGTKSIWALINGTWKEQP
jgi:hypothetical protein